MLYDVPDNQVYRIIAAPNVALLNAIGIFKGQEVLKKATYKHGGPVLVEIESREVAIGKDFATQITVEKSN
ncbi:MAG: hypothetical protein BEN19_05500 [Epulopiscium sp. Nuni2H_MBin003]|nr:MAG: hypothetical protein BEN19_05500 [Epulopiscium sp. Nuni2H_MBin003]